MPERSNAWKAMSDWGTLHLIYIILRNKCAPREGPMLFA